MAPTVACSLKNSLDSDMVTIRKGKNDSRTLAATEKA